MASAFILARERDAAKLTAYGVSLAENLVLRLVKEGIVSSKPEAVVREGLPATDYGLANETWITGVLNANAWNNYVNVAFNQRRYSAHYGVSNLAGNPGISAVRYQIGAGGANTMEVIPVEAMYAEMNVSGYFTPPVLYKPGETIFIQVYGTIAQTERFVLRSLVTEPSGQVSAPRLETRMM